MVKGVIREVMPAESMVVIRHDEIPDYMSAMVMPFTVKDPAELANLHSGDAVTFRMLVTEDDGWIEDIQVTQRAPTTPVNTLPPSAPIRVVRDVEPLEVGDLLPNYTFTNQFGQAVQLDQFRGQALAITFIFTRCPFPTFCPRMSANFADVQNRLKAVSNAPTNWQLLTLSFDPAYDTPAVLKDYAGRYNYDPARWSFLTGSLLDITALTEQFGVQFWREKPEEPINHNLRTVVVNASGHVQKIFPNNDWTTVELLTEIFKAAGE